MSSSPLKSQSLRSQSPKKGSESPKKSEYSNFLSLIFLDGGQSPTNEKQSVYKHRNLTLRDIEVEHLKTTIISLHEEYKVVEDLHKDVKNLRDKEIDHRAGARDLSTFVEGTLKQQSVEEDQKNVRFEEMLNRENADLAAEIQEVMREIERTNREREEQRKRYEVQIQQRETIISQFEQSNEQVRQEIADMKARLRLEQVEEELRNLKAFNSQQQKQKEKLQQDLRTASQYIKTLEEKIYKANQTSYELLKQLKDAETEIETLKQYIIELKQRIAVYIPVKEDLIDKKLAEYINNYPERNKLKIMFMRESEGIYQFGTKRVYVRVDKDKINIRVGGGYLSIDEFLDQYTPAELEKLERKDPLKKFSEKVAVQKTLVGKELRESSPIRGSGDSPTSSPTRSPVRSSTAKSPQKRV